MKNYSIRELSWGELDEGAKVIRDSFRTVADDFNFTYENNPMHGAFLKTERLQNECKKGIKMYGLFMEEKQVGFVAFEKIGNNTYEMQKLGVVPSCRHLGYGKKLVEFIKNLAKEDKQEKIIIGIIEENYILKKWYEKMGFKTEKVMSFKHLPFLVGIMSYNLEEE